MSYSILPFYSEANVFITGGTGFLGKALIEKLLYSIHDLGTVYVLMRASKGKTAAERVEEFKRDYVFGRIRRDRPHALSKIVAIEGDIALPHLGISADDIKLLSENVHIVFHAAAMIKFNEPIQVAANLNLRATVRVTELCREMRRFKVLVHCSTAFSNTDHAIIEERVYPSRITVEDFLLDMDTLSEDELRRRTPEYLAKKANTYIMTKALAENAIDSCGLASIIVRPSLVCGAVSEPHPGWIEGMSSVNNFTVPIATGQLHDLHGVESGVGDVIPVDVSVNGMIAAASYAVNCPSTSTPVINLASSALNPLHWEEYRKVVNQFFNNFPTSKAVDRPHLTMHESGLAFEAAFFLRHTVPARVKHTLMRVVGMKTPSARSRAYLSKMAQTVRGMTTCEWLIRGDNLVEMWEALDEKDQKIFPFDIRTLSWPDYLADYCMGARQLLIGDSLSDKDVSIARGKMEKFRLHSLFKLIALFATPATLYALLTRHSLRRALTLSLLSALVIKFFGRPTRSSHVALRSLEYYQNIYHHFQAKGRVLED